MALKSDYTPSLEIADEPVAQKPSLEVTPSIIEDASTRLQQALDDMKPQAQKIDFKPMWHQHADAYFDTSPMEPFMIGPGMATFGSLGIIGGAPKVGKTDFMLHMFSHFAVGKPFLKFVPLRPLKIAYLQCEVGYQTLRIRMRFMGLDPATMAQGKGNFLFTDKFESVLTPENLEKAAQSILEQFQGELPDIIAIDPLRNVFDGGAHHGGENSNDAMIYFLRNVKALLRDRVNPNACLLIAHHTRKPTAQERAKGQSGVFDQLAGAGGLRGMYDFCIMITHQDEDDPDNNHRVINIEARGSIREIPELRAPERFVTGKDTTGAWQVVQELYADEDKRTKTFREDRDQKNEVIMNFIYDEAEKSGRLYTREALVKTLEDKYGLGGTSSLRTRIDVLSQKWRIKMTNEAYRFGDFAQSSRASEMYLVVYDTKMPDGRIVPATHCANRTGNGLMEVNDPRVWQLND